MGQSQKPRKTLKRNLSLLVLSLAGIGNILGAGIYVITGEVGKVTGMAAPLSFLLASAVAFISAMTYSEISARLPLSSGEAVFVHRAFGSKKLGLAVGFSIAIAGMVSAATITRGFAGYFLEYVPVHENLAMAGLLVVMGALALWGIKEAALGASLLTIVEVSGLLIIIITGHEEIYNLPQKAGQMFSIQSFLDSPGSVFLGAFLAFYAYIGFEDMVNIAEEVKAPEKNMGRAIFISLGTAAVLYILVSYVAVSVLSPEEFAATKAPLSMVFEKITGKNPLVISLIASFAVVNGALFQIIMASRIFYGMSKEGWLPGFISNTSERTSTPVAATVIVTAVIGILSIFFRTDILARSTSFIVLLVFVMIHLSLIRLKKKSPKPEGVKTYPVVIPYLGIVICSLFLLIEIFM